MIRIVTIALITIITNIFTKGDAQDFTASISGQQNSIVLAPENDDNYEINFKCGVSKVPFNGIVYNTVSVNGRCWLDRNLGAKRVAQHPGDKKGFGDYYQWGRLNDGHQVKRSITTILLSEIDKPGFAGFITTRTQPYDWHVPQNDELWDNLLPDSNNPCPAGWKVATKKDLSLISLQNNTILDLYKSPLKIPAAGYRDGKSGNITDAGNKTFLWTSNSTGKKAYALEADNNSVRQNKYARANGMPVRCVKSE